MSLDFWPLETFCSHKFERPHSLCDPLVPDRGDVMLHGPPESGKTQVALTLSNAIAEGADFLNQFPCIQGKVLIVQADTPTLTFQDRLQRLKLLLAEEARGNIASLIDDSGRFDIVKAAQSKAAAIVAAQAFAPNIVVFDALRDIHLLDEIDSRSPRIVYGACRSLFPSAALIYMHHDRKGNVVGKRLRDEEASGSGAWRNSIDFSWHLERYYDHEQPFKHIATLGFSKTRQSERPLPIRLEMDKESLLVEPTEMTPLQLAGIWIRKEPGMGEKEIINRLLASEKCSRATAYRTAKRAVSQGRLRGETKGPL